MNRHRCIRLTKRSVDALGAQDKDTLVWDRDLPGFGVRVLPSGRKVFVVQSRGPQGSRRVSLGRHGALTPEAARKKARVVIDRIKRGEPAKPENSAPLTVADLAERFLREYVGAHCKPSTAKLYRGSIGNHIVPALGHRSVASVKRADVMALQQSLHDTPCGANHALRVLSSMMRMAQMWELIPEGANPCASVRPYRVSERERFLSREELVRLGRVLNETEADGSVGAGAIAAIRLLALTGCRRSEIASLVWDDVDFTAGVLRLRDSKTGPRTVPLTRAVVTVLEGLRPADNGLPRATNKVIRGGQFGGGRSRLHQHWKTVRKRAGLEDVRLHDLRHSYASAALELGESLQTIGRLLGHRKLATTAKYAHLVRDAEQAAAGRVGASIGAHLGPNELETP